MKLSDINSDFLTILDARISGDWPTVNETSLSRAYQHTTNGHFGILTNHRAGRTIQQNREGFYRPKDGSFHPNKIAQAYSSLPGKKGTFVFEYRAQSFIEALMETNHKRS